MVYPNQSAYQAGRSTETILLKIVSDILSAWDDCKLLLLSLLNLLHLTPLIIPCFNHISALCFCLSCHFVLSVCLSWLHSYLSNHTETVFVSGFKLSSSLASLKDQSLDQSLLFCTPNSLLLLSVTVLFSTTDSLMTINFMLMPISVNFIRSFFSSPKLPFLMSSLRCITRNCSCAQDEHDSHYSKTYSENPNFAVFHPAEWL